MTTESLLQNSLGTVYVQPKDGGRPTLTLHILDDYSIVGKRVPMPICLFDDSGTSVSPGSQRVGWSGKRGSSDCQLVCDDDVSAETRERLIAVGYHDVIARP